MTSPLNQAQDGAAVRLNPFWKWVQARLSTAETAQILMDGKPQTHPLGKVYRVTENWGTPVGAKAAQWGREVIIPSTTLWPAVEIDPGKRGVGWTVRSEMNQAPGYDVTLSLDRLQQIAYERLVGQAPESVEQGWRIVLPIWRQRPPQGMPEWDPERELWWLSSEFRAEITRV